jgi:peptidoglycan/LPS O-acetylase OafA/YrhL
MSQLHTDLPPDPRYAFNTALNGYRGLCALLVFVYHCGSVRVIPWPSGTPLQDSLRWLWSACAYGVEMFFMISGFVILGSLLRHRNVSSFLNDRFIRIFTAWVPALCAVTLVCALLQMKMFADTTPFEVLTLFVANLLLLPPLAPLPMIHLVSWSLTYEWIFYFAAALGFLLTRNGTARPWTRTYWAIALWACCAGLFVCLFPRALFFLTGVLVFKHYAWFAAHRRWLRLPIVSLGIFLLAWRATGAGPAHLSQTLFDFLLDGRWLAALLAFAAALHLFASVCLNASRAFAFLNGRSFQFLGTISYSFYLWHSLVMSVMRRLVEPYIMPHFGVAIGFAVFVVSALAVSIPVSWASWKLFEVTLAKRLRRKRDAQPAIGGAVRVP